MRLYLKNIGMIKEADVKLDGLTVIAGENDTGKSTVGKVIFSIVKGMNKYNETLRGKFKKEIETLTQEFFKKYVKIFDEFKKSNKKNNNLNLTELFLIGLNPIIFSDNILDSFEKNETKIFFRLYENIFKNFNNKSLETDFKELEKKLNKILDIKNYEKIELKKIALERAFFSEFRYQLKLANSEIGKITITEKKEKNIEINIGNKNKIELNNDFDLFLEDATLIETPMILNFSDMIQNARSHFEEEELAKNNRNILTKMEADVIYHSKDLINKLVNASKFFENKEIDKNLLRFLNFDFEYNKETREFIYVKGKEKFHSINVADGIKSFGIIKLLLKGSYIRKNTLLIIDEPEVHLHPKWQIEYAKLIVELVKRNIKVLITSHSPYFLEALDIFSQKTNINTNFYFAEDGFIKEDKNLEKSIKKLVEPMKELKRLRYE